MYEGPQEVNQNPEAWAELNDVGAYLWVLNYFHALCGYKSPLNVRIEPVIDDLVLDKLIAWTDPSSMKLDWLNNPELDFLWCIHVSEVYTFCSRVYVPINFVCYVMYKLFPM